MALPTRVRPHEAGKWWQVSRRAWVGVHWSVLVMVILIGWLLGGQVLPEMTPGESAVTYWAVAVPCAAAFMAALLGHELAHSLVAAGPAMSLAAGLIFGGLAAAVHAGGGPGITVAALGWLAGCDERPARGL